MNDHTRPERATELHVCRRLRAKVLQDPCGHCINRTMAWGNAICSGVAGRTFWACLKDQRHPTFALDDSTVKETP